MHNDATVLPPSALNHVALYSAGVQFAAKGSCIVYMSCNVTTIPIINFAVAYLLPHCRLWAAAWK